MFLPEYLGDISHSTQHNNGGCKFIISYLGVSGRIEFDARLNFIGRLRLSCNIQRDADSKINKTKQMSQLKNKCLRSKAGLV